VVEDQSSLGRALVTRVARVLKVIAHQLHIPVIIANNSTMQVTVAGARDAGAAAATTAVDDEASSPTRSALPHTLVTPMLGKAWRSVANDRLYLNADVDR
jgi:hypothetical protein